jgi:UDPglucose 6-dehydrogenase
MTNTHPISTASVIGLGKLGLSLAAVLAQRGFGVVGVDVDESKVDLINRGKSPIYEPGLEKIIRANSDRFRATAKHREAVLNSGVTFVVVPTPSDRRGVFSLKYVTRAMKDIGEALSKKRGYHLVVLTSTVMPGSMDGVVQPTLERSSGRKQGAGFGLCYNPEFIALGNVIEGLLKPDFVLIGESDVRAGGLLSEIQSRICTNSPPLERMNFVNAEIAKIAVNSFVTMKMSFANTLAEISERVAGANVDTITKAVGRDKRIGTAYLKGALGYGGPCFPRDNIAFEQFARRVGAQADLARVTHTVNLRQIARILKLLDGEALRPPLRIGILGLTYKPDTNVLEASQSIMLAEALRDRGYEIHVYDPAAMAESQKLLGTRVTYESGTESCLRNSDVCIIATPWKEFHHLDKSLLKGKTILDCWRILDRTPAESTRYIAIGLGKGPTTGQ